MAHQHQRQPAPSVTSPSKSKSSAPPISGRYFLEEWPACEQERVRKEVLRRHKQEGKIPATGAAPLDTNCDLLWNVFRVREHVNMVRSHQRFIVKTFERLRQYFPHVTEEQAANHDESKLSFVEMIGYTEKWVWTGAHEATCWTRALLHHYENNPHHPEFHVDKDTSVQKNMGLADLEESVIDMLACQWERQLHGSDDVTDSQLASISERYLTRYTQHDRERAKAYLHAIQQSSVLA